MVKKEIGIILVVLSSLLLISMIVGGVIADYQYSKNIYSYWSLADKASTIQQKSQYIDQFVNALNNSNLNGMNDALFLKTRDNSFDYNFQALQSLQSRLVNISTMDENSFAYQTAISQITAQEQGQAQDMLDIFAGCWYLQNYPLLWNWICGIIIFLLLGLEALGGVLWYQSYKLD